ncbi:MAG: chloride channel protein [Pirellulales bacterium]
MTRRFFEPFYRHLRSIFDTESTGRLLLYSPLVGAVAGLGAAGFYWALSWLWGLAVEQGMGYIPPQAGNEPSLHAAQAPTHLWAVLLIPALGGLVCGWLVYHFAPEAEGHGTDAMVKAFHRQRGQIRPRVPVIKSIASVLTIGTGGSAGREGPIAQIGAGFGSLLATRLQLGEQDRRQLMLAGAAGGIGAIFHAPLGGALFVTEVLYGSTALEFSAVVPCVISSITAFTVFTTIFGHMQAVTAPLNMEFTHLSELPVFLVFALLCSLVGYLYVLTFYGLRNRFFRHLPIPNTLKPALGGLMLGVLAFNLPQIMGGGYGWIQMAIDNPKELGIWTMLLLCIAKVAATSLTISSGGSGGVFAPSLFIGAMLGGAFSQACDYFFPGIIQEPAAYVLVGMGGFFAGVAKVPLTAVIMVCEMSGSYGLLVPLMLVSIINVAMLSSRWTLYEEQVPTILDSPAHQGDFIVDVLEQIQVKDVFHPDRRLDLIQQNTPLPEILRLAALSENNYFPVIDDRQELVGIFSLRDLRSVLTGDGAGPLVVALDIATQPVLTVAPEDDLHTALRRFTQKNIDDIPVVDTDRPTKILGLLSRKDLIAAYHDRVTSLQHHKEGADS